MIHQNEARMFLAQNRSVTQLDYMKSWSTFNDTVSDSIMNPFLNLKDNVLAPGRSLSIMTDESADVMLLPVAGTIECNFNKGKNVILNTGEAGMFSLKQKDSIEIFNTYEDQFINFLEVWVKPGYLNTPSENLYSSFELDANKNTLTCLFNDDKQNNSLIRFYIGRFDGRQEALFQISKPGSALFVFVIDGAFEVQYRLLETRDALMLWNLETADIEALSNTAVILLAEIECA